MGLHTLMSEETHTCRTYGTNLFFILSFSSNTPPVWNKHMFSWLMDTSDSKKQIFLKVLSLDLGMLVVFHIDTTSPDKSKPKWNDLYLISKYGAGRKLLLWVLTCFKKNYLSCSWKCWKIEKRETWIWCSGSEHMEADPAHITFLKPHNRHTQLKQDIWI